MNRQVMNKKARYNLCFDEVAQELNEKLDVIEVGKMCLVYCTPQSCHPVGRKYKAADVVQKTEPGSPFYPFGQHFPPSSRRGNLRTRKNAFCQLLVGHKST